MNDTETLLLELIKAQQSRVESLDAEVARLRAIVDELRTFLAVLTAEAGDDDGKPWKDPTEGWSE